MTQRLISKITFLVLTSTGAYMGPIYEQYSYSRLRIHEVGGFTYIKKTARVVYHTDGRITYKGFKNVEEALRFVVEAEACARKTFIKSPRNITRCPDGEAGKAQEAAP